MIAATAAGSATSAWTQVLPPVATVVAAIAGAIITGFGAASLRHKWDVEADERRWRRERDARVRAQRLEAFAAYLSARPNLNTVTAITAGSGDPAPVVSAARLAAANLMIFLPGEEQRDVVQADLQTVETWVGTWFTRSSTDLTDVPSGEKILDLARSLVVEPETDAGHELRGPREAGRSPRAVSRGHG